MSETTETTALEYSPIRFWFYRVFLSPFSTKVVGYEGETAIVDVKSRWWHPAYWWFRLNPPTYVECAAGDEC